MMEETEITGEEAEAGALIGMKVTGTVGGKGTLDIKAGAAVQVLITTEVAIEAGMMMDSGIGVGVCQ